MSTPSVAPSGRQERLPARPGTILASVPKDAVKGPKLTPLERQALDKAGWKPTDPIPDLTDTQLGQRLTREAQKIGEEAANLEGLTPVPPNTPPIKPPELRDISELSPAEQQQFADTVAELNEVRQRIDAARRAKTASETAGPGINTNIPGMAQAAAAVQQAAAEPAPEPAPEPTPEFLSEERNSICPRCGLDLDNPATEPTKTDIMTYVQTVLGGQRFVKKYQLFDGRVTIIFRSLTTLEEECIKEQLTADVRTKQLLSQQEARVRHAEYRMALGLAAVVRAGQPTIELDEPLDFARTHTGDESKIIALRYRMLETLKTDTLKRAVAACWSNFWDILVFLEAKATSSDFYKGIEAHD